MASASPLNREERESRSPNPKRALSSPRSKRPRSASRSSSPDGGKRRRGQDRTVSVCRDYLLRACFRNAVDCKFAHPPPSVSVEQDKVTVCGDSLRRKCLRGDQCRYYHPPPHIQESLGNELGLEGEKPNTICQDFLRGKCSRSEKECRFSHYSSVNTRGIACQDFLRGRCDRKSCRYFHPSSRGISPVHHRGYEAPILPPPPAPPRYSYNEETVQVCKDYLNGMCNRGSCKYLHRNLSQHKPHYEDSERRTYSNPRSSYDEEKVRVCKDFLNGMCKRDSCRYLHPQTQPIGLVQTVYGTIYNNQALSARLPSPPRYNIEHIIYDYGSTRERSRSPPRHSYERESGEVCKDFMNGMCRRGSCKFMHSIPEPKFYEHSYREARVPSPRSPPRTSREKETGPVCRDFLKGSCNRGNCKFAHRIAEPKVIGPSYVSYNASLMRSPSPPRISRDEMEEEDKIMVCKDFLNKTCNRKTCKFAHPNSDANVVNGKVEICRDYKRGACARPVCHFYHPKTKR